MCVTVSLRVLGDVYNKPTLTCVAARSMNNLVAVNVPPARRATALGTAFSGFHSGVSISQNTLRVHPCIAPLSKALFSTASVCEPCPAKWTDLGAPCYPSQQGWCEACVVSITALLFVNRQPAGAGAVSTSAASLWVAVAVLHFRRDGRATAAHVEPVRPTRAAASQHRQRSLSATSGRRLQTHPMCAPIAVLGWSHVLPVVEPSCYHSSNATNTNRCTHI